MTPTITVNVSLGVVSDDGEYSPGPQGRYEKLLLASDHDNEENAVRAAEQLVREAFRKARQPN